MRSRVLSILSKRELRSVRGALSVKVTHSSKYPRDKSIGTFIGSHQPRYSADILISVSMFFFFNEGTKGLIFFLYTSFFYHSVSE